MCSEIAAHYLHPVFVGRGIFGGSAQGDGLHPAASMRSAGSSWTETSTAGSATWRGMDGRGLRMSQHSEGQVADL